MNRIWSGLLIAVTVASAAVAGQAVSGTAWPIEEAPADLRPMVSRADVMIVAMQDSLLRQLDNKLPQGLAVAADASHMDPDLLAQRIGRDLGIASGFTSDRLRNPTKRPRPWAADIVASYAGRRARDVQGFAVDLGDKVGVLRPMVVQKMCLTCHGPVDQISPAVRQILTERYPADRAVGFAEGEIRGWFWVEMPRTGRAKEAAR